MTVTADGATITLQGNCGIDDAETLLGFLQAQPAPMVDLTNATHLHGAVLQLLLAFRPPLSGQATDMFTRTWLIPLVRGT
jgi:hypothetical protein